MRGSSHETEKKTCSLGSKGSNTILWSHDKKVRHWLKKKKSWKPVMMSIFLWRKNSFFFFFLKALSQLCPRKSMWGEKKTSEFYSWFTMTCKVVPSGIFTLEMYHTIRLASKLWIVAHACAHTHSLLNDQQQSDCLHSNIRVFIQHHFQQPFL